MLPGPDCAGRLKVGRFSDGREFSKIFNAENLKISLKYLKKTMSYRFDFKEKQSYKNFTKIRLF